MLLAFEPHGLLQQGLDKGLDFVYLFPKDSKRSGMLNDRLNAEIHERLDQLQFDPKLDSVYLVGIFPACVRLTALLVDRYGKDVLKCYVWDPTQSTYRSMRF